MDNNHRQFDVLFRIFSIVGCQFRNKPLKIGLVNFIFKCQLLRVPAYIFDNYPFDQYMAFFLCGKFDCAKGGRFIMVPLREYPKLSEMVSMCRSSPKCDFWFPMCRSVVFALFVGILVGMFAAGCSEAGNKIMVGILFGMLAASFSFLMFLRAGLADEVEKILFDGVEYDQRTSSDFMGEGIL